MWDGVIYYAKLWLPYVELSHSQPLLTPVHRSIHLFIPSLIYSTPSPHPLPGASARRKTLPSLKEFLGCDTCYLNPPLSQLQEPM